MEKSSFFNAVRLDNGAWDRVYKAEDFADFFQSIMSNGVFYNPANSLQIISNNNMTVTLKKGKAYINGYFYHNTEDLILNIDPADSVLNRIDRVVLRLDFLKREIKAYVKKGSFASSPAVPTLQRDTDIYELGIADIKINKGTVKISATDITDTRANPELCGIVSTFLQDDIQTNIKDVNKKLDGKLDKTAYTAQDVLNKVKTVDGTGSGLDADLLDGLHASAFKRQGLPGDVKKIVWFKSLNLYSDERQDFTIHNDKLLHVRTHKPESVTYYYYGDVRADEGNGGGSVTNMTQSITPGSYERSLCIRGPSSFTSCLAYDTGNYSNGPGAIITPINLISKIKLRRFYCHMRTSDVDYGYVDVIGFDNNKQNTLWIKGRKNNKSILAEFDIPDYYGDDDKFYPTKTYQLDRDYGGWRIAITNNYFYCYDDIIRNLYIYNKINSSLKQIIDLRHLPVFGRIFYDHHTNELYGYVSKDESYFFYNIIV
ncbi:hypothetical protein CLPU_41c00030 [Gottschalkia purinilytica]|uniref:Uncharacterized protein n=1 Tax=Gottschalkia purinilytica TaxID=1503 RepID=A0A0L0W669_GOTPU|nr:hypothetical protein [Gottschalkia purinilytica]KNF06967.1 hypothetical protein CLPU_41c00030 [Gottschalkia purinilytica]